MNDIPRTDEAIVDWGDISDCGWGRSPYVYANFARQLERENNELRKDKERLDWLCARDGSDWAWLRTGEQGKNITRAAIDKAMEWVK